MKKKIQVDWKSKSKSTVDNSSGEEVKKKELATKPTKKNFSNFTKSIKEARIKYYPSVGVRKTLKVTPEELDDIDNRFSRDTLRYRKTRKTDDGNVEIVFDDDLAYRKASKLAKSFSEEAVPANNVSGGAIKGAAGDPPGPKAKIVKTLKRKNPALPIKESMHDDVFAGNPVFNVDSTYFHHCKNGKRKYLPYANYVGFGDEGERIREYGLKYPEKPIILRDKSTKAMIYLRYGKSN
jgi:hypothetical protein